MLVQANHGRRERLAVNGAPVGAAIPARGGARRRSRTRAGAGSIIVLVATDAPLLATQCTRLAQRASFGIARTGGMGEHWSGDLLLAFSTANRGLPAGALGEPAPLTLQVEMLADVHLDVLFEAAIEATEEAILNALLGAETMTGRDGLTAHALDPERLLAVLDRHGGAAGPERSPDAAGFERLEQQRAHEYVAEQIRRQIVLRLIPSGQALPPERELAAIFGVGRATVQQAIRLLAEDHLLESRRGRHGGGNFVLGPDEDRAGMELLLGAAAPPPRPRSRTRSPTGARSSPPWRRSPPRSGRRRTCARWRRPARRRPRRRATRSSCRPTRSSTSRSPGPRATASSARRWSRSGSSSTTR